MTVTLDASVWLASLHPHEPSHASSRALLVKLLEQRVPLHQPGLFVVELCATVTRRTGDRALAVEAGRAALRWPGLVMHELDHALAASAADVAASFRLRGADAVYVATARHVGAVLITLDGEVRERGGRAVDAATPSGWLSMHR